MSLKIKKIIDLTHNLTLEVPTWDGSCGFELTTLLDHHQCTGATKFKIQAFHLKKAGTGTHIDAPAHCFPGKPNVADLPLDQLVVKAYVINVSSKALSDYLISFNDIVSFEKLYGTIQENSLVIAYTGWSNYWHDSKKYRNENEHGVMRFPTFSSEAAQLLIERNIAGIAIDTLSPDLQDSGYPVHQLLLSHNKYIIENIAHCEQMPPVNAYVVALPLKIKATECPIRIVGLVVD
jgi:kynurenine formamidase